MAIAASVPETGPPLMELRGVGCSFQVRRGLFAPRAELRAVRGVDLTIARGEVLGLVGESGCGKTTLSRVMLGLLRPSTGAMLLDGRPLAELPQRAIARRIQPVFQDPYASLNPRHRIGAIVGLPLAVHRIGTPESRRQAVTEMLGRCGLDPRFLDAYPDQLSGGQRQRAAIARALVMRPEIVICDEPTSALDVSVQAQILNLLQDLRAELGLTYVFISHNLAVVEHIATRVSVMYLGRIVEAAPTRALFDAPQHPYTRALLASALTPDPALGMPSLELGTSFPNPLAIPAGCSFHPRCPQAFAPCAAVAPRFTQAAGHAVECHLHDASAPGGTA